MHVRRPPAGFHRTPATIIVLSSVLFKARNCRALASLGAPLSVGGRQEGAQRHTGSRAGTEMVRPRHVGRTRIRLQRSESHNRSWGLLLAAI